MSLETPIVYIVFNRPAHTRQTFDKIRKQRPKQLFIVADGPRANHPDDLDKCAAVRAIVEHIDWPCVVHKNYAASNMGLKDRVSSGLNWVFDHVESAIIIEDDCLAHDDFFNFCTVLLERYVDDNRISVITGNNFQDGKKRGAHSYYFSKYNHCWGWATWRRAWNLYQGDIPFWNDWVNSDDWKGKFTDLVERNYWERIFKKVYAGEIDSWAYPWTASLWYRGGLTVTPNVNLVANIGFGIDATHTTSVKSLQSNIPTNQIGELFPFPYDIYPNIIADRYVFDEAFGGRNLRFPSNFLRIPRRLIRYFYRQILHIFG